MPRSRPEDRVRRLVEMTDEGAAAELFLMLCRASPELRHWLWEDFARDPKTRDTFRTRLRSRNGTIHRFADLGEDGDAWRAELRELQRRIPCGLYGGLTWSQLERLIARHRAGQADLGVFLLAQAWQASGRHPLRTPRLVRAVIEFVEAAFADPHLWRQMERASDLADATASRASRRATLGHTDWWKLNVLLFVLRNPRPSYAIRELRAHLARQGMTVSVKYLQRFCAQHGIKRDMRAGRPRSRPPDTTGATPVNGHAAPSRGRPTASELHRP